MVSPPSVRIADALAGSLPEVLDTLSAERYGGPLPFRPVISSPPVRCRLAPPEDLPPLESTFTIRHGGGNVYEVEGRIDGRPARSFRYCLPDPAPLLVPAAPRLTREVATFMLDELERRLGRNLLRQALVSTAPGSAPPTTQAPPPREPRDGGAKRR